MDLVNQDGFANGWKDELCLKVFSKSALYAFARAQ